MTSTELKQQLLSIDFYKQYPSMAPFVGINYQNDSHKKMLVIAESFYLPKNESLHLEPVKWYKSTEKDLASEEHIKWIDLEHQFRDHVNGKFIYNKLDKCVRNSMNVANGCRGVDEFAFMNFFIRPAQDRKSIVHTVDKLDIEKSREVLKNVLYILQPDLVVFVSKYSYYSFGKYKELFPHIKFFVTCHPQCRYWVDKRYNGRGKFIEILNNEWIIRT